MGAALFLKGRSALNNTETDNAVLTRVAPFPAGENEEAVALLAENDVVVVALTGPAGSRIIRISGETTETLWNGEPGTRPTALCRFHGAKDNSPALYATIAKPDGGVVLRGTQDGGFEPVSPPGFGVGAGWLGPMTVWNGTLIVAAGTSAPYDVAAEPLAAPWLMASADPASGKWEAIADAGFGDAENHALSALAVVDGVLYAGTSNLVRGFQLWSCVSAGKWQRLLLDGAGRFSRNQRVSAISGEDGEIFIGTGYGTTAPEDEEEAIPIGPELLSLDPGSGQWDIIMGEPRFSDQGLKVPAALMGPGFDVSQTADLVSIVCAGDTILAITAKRNRKKGQFGIGEPEGVWFWQSYDFGESFTEVLLPSPSPLAAIALQKDGMLLATTGELPALVSWNMGIAKA